MDCGDLLERKLTCQAFFVDALEQTGPFFPVNLDSRANDFARPIMSFFIERVHISTSFAFLRFLGVQIRSLAAWLRFWTKPVRLMPNWINRPKLMITQAM